MTRIRRYSRRRGARTAVRTGGLIVGALVGAIGCASRKPPPSGCPPTRPVRAVPATAEAQVPAEILALREPQHDPGVALLKMDEYRRRHPREHTAEVERYMDEKFDAIWWERIDQLFKKRDRIGVDIAKTQSEVHDEADPEGKRRGIAQIQRLRQELGQTQQILRETMGYAEEEPPPPFNKAALSVLAARRDDGKYTSWKKLTLRAIRDNHGKLPWEGDQ